MSTYVRVANGAVAEVISALEIEGVEIPVTERYTPDFVAALIDVTEISPTPEAGWTTADNLTFKAPSEA